MSASNRILYTRLKIPSNDVSYIFFNCWRGCRLHYIYEETTGPLIVILHIFHTLRLNTEWDLRAHGGCDRSAGDAYSSMAPDPTSGSCAPILWFVFPIWLMRLNTVRYFRHFIRKWILFSTAFIWHFWHILFYISTSFYSKSVRRYS